MRNKNIWIGIALVAAIALVAVLAMVLPARIASPATDAPTLESGRRGRYRRYGGTHRRNNCRTHRRAYGHCHGHRYGQTYRHGGNCRGSDRHGRFRGQVYRKAHEYA